jgi:hypothetical protein
VIDQRYDERFPCGVTGPDNETLIWRPLWRMSPDQVLNALTLAQVASYTDADAKARYNRLLYLVQILIIPPLVGS